MLASVAGRVALVTGSTRGIGAAIAQRLAGAGVMVGVCGRSADAGEAVAEDIRGRGGTARYLPLDIGSEDSVRAVVLDCVREFGRLDILVNNAAPTDQIIAGTDRSLLDLTTEDLGAMLVPGLYGQVWACRYALPHLIESGHGSIVNISSMAAELGMPGMPAYSMAKGALNALSRQVAVDYARRGVRSNTIVIGYVLSGEALAYLDGHPTAGAALRAATLTEPGSPEDVADAALFLASDSSRYITGSEIKLDGGLMCSRDLPNIPAAFAEAVQ
ncbi:SDR family oxidoreductase [Pseudonocardia eucalypti]|uniref:SDR family oxidoreductase n=1 Tax=Pseudonocardia eucalypti TaxID=648755 RepID=A0ABP9RF31_9PSEU|nr:NAD(P)-dependent dehydrogenase (short-subunit alcohol dehydrogenase family) [Pseudonocardia eucalypti]